MGQPSLHSDLPVCEAVETCVCLHCGSPAPAGAVYCCKGCEAAATVIDTPVYEQDFTPFVESDEAGHQQIRLTVFGIHCGSCIRAIEGVLKDHPLVTSARVNMSTGRLFIRWQGEPGLVQLLTASVINLGYELRPADTATGIQDEKTVKSLLLALGVAGFAAGNLMLLSFVLWSSSADEMGEGTRQMFHWISAMIAVPAVLWSGRPFFRSAITVLKAGHTNMDVPISLAITLACAVSVFETMANGQHVYFDSAVMLVFFLLIGRVLDARAKARARASASGLLAKLARSARVIDPETGEQRDIPAHEISVGMTVLVAAGENIPADGVVISGTSDIDKSLITGETIPETAEADTNVFAGTTNVTKSLTIEVTKKYSESLLSEIIELMETCEQGGSRFVRIADRAASIYTPAVHALAAITMIGWMVWMQAGWQVSLMNATTVLIITCPCALGLAVPVVQMLASGRLMNVGILLKSGDALERLAKVDTAIFDKTGTLTEGDFELLSGDWTPADLNLAASLAMHSRHPLSRALVGASTGPYADLDAEELPGLGLKAMLDGEEIRLGQRSFAVVGDEKVPLATGTEIWLQKGAAEPICFRLMDKLKQDAQAVFKALHAGQIETHIVSGDRAAAVNKVAEVLSPDHTVCEAQPRDKSEYIEALQARGRSVLYVGDGLNDAPALHVTDVSMSPAEAVDISQNVADIIFQNRKLQPVVYSLQIARKAEQLVKQNMALAILYNMIAVPIAVMGYATPLIAAIAMSSSSLIVVANSFRLNLLKYTPYKDNA